jgi:hypothetical protein
MYKRKRSSVQKQALSPSLELVAAEPGGDKSFAEVGVSAPGEEVNDLEVVASFRHGYSESRLVPR